MLKLKKCLSLFILICALLLIPFSAYASVKASSSNAERKNNDIGEDYEKEYHEDYESTLLPYLENIDGLVTDIHSQLVPYEVPDQGHYSVMSLGVDDVSTFALDSDFGIKSNVIIYEGTWGGQSYRAVFPASYEQNLIVTDEGYLYNLSGSTVTGRLFQDDVDYLEYEYSSLVLNSVLGNVASTIYNYGYPSYVRTYYLQNGRITNSDSYGLFRVDNIVRTQSSNPDSITNNYILILILIGGMSLLCFMKKSHN